MSWPEWSTSSVGSGVSSRSSSNAAGKAGEHVAGIVTAITQTEQAGLRIALALGRDAGRDDSTRAVRSRGAIERNQGSAILRRRSPSHRDFPTRSCPLGLEDSP